MAKAIINDMDISGTVAVDQQFNGSSPNAQSGVAINGALTNKQDKIKMLDVSATTSNLGNIDSGYIGLSWKNTVILNIVTNYSGSSAVSRGYIPFCYLANGKYYIRVVDHEMQPVVNTSVSVKIFYIEY